MDTAIQQMGANIVPLVFFVSIVLETEVEESVWIQVLEPRPLSMSVCVLLQYQY